MIKCILMGIPKLFSERLSNSFPRDEIVIMTKVCVSTFTYIILYSDLSIDVGIFGGVKRGFTSIMINADDSEGYVNQHGLSRKI
jgi:hypothetical protein